ncbi:choice-of-anchor L domain-containing protein, partial [Winogradskyella pacifica]
MKKIIYIFMFLVIKVGFSQDLLMQDGTFNRCAPDLFYDSGGELGSYSDNESYVTTICAENSGDRVSVNFVEFLTQLNQDFLTIYDGDDVSADIIGVYTGVSSPGFVSASESNTSGCLTFAFTSNESGNIDGWVAEIICITPCQDIIPSINNTIPIPNESGVIGILPGETVDFFGSAMFSLDGSGATYNWDFGDGNTGTGTEVSNTFLTDGTFIVTLTVTDNNPLGCSEVTTIPVFVMGPNVIIDQNIFTPEELITEVLINSPCASVSDITWSTGSSITSSQPNGIGYFFGDGLNFPFSDGILLSSGEASDARGPNNLSLGNGSNVWGGDDDLNAALGVNSHNATFIQFNFTPLSDKISFEFLMASEEYNMGSFECVYSDAFAFLLTDSAGNVSNLAVIPNTNLPVLVTNIHPDNGESCGGANEEYFGEYIPYNQPPIAFDGRTAVFTAQSAVIPGENYTIKLVIADDRDNTYDSGVFLKAGSFDLGGDLGDDITIEAGNAQCGGTEIVLDTAAPFADHVWYYAADPTLPNNRMEIEGETGSMLTVTETGIYSVDVAFETVCQFSDTILVEFIGNPVVNLAPDLVICSSTGEEEFNLSENNDIVLGDQSSAEYSVTYHLTEDDAIDNLNPLPDLYTNVSNPQILWVRLADVSQVCSVVTSFQLSAASAPTINAVPDLEICDDVDNDGLGSFDLSDQTLGILGSQ